MIAALSERVAALNAIFRLIAHERDEGALLGELCELLVTRRPYALVWIGRAARDGRVDILAQRGDAPGFFSDIHVRWDDTPEGHGTVGPAIREHVTHIAATSDAALAPWHERFTRFGIHSVIALPFRFEDTTDGVLIAYSRQDVSVLREDIALLEVVTGVLGMKESLIAQEVHAERRLRRLETLWRLLVRSDFSDAHAIGTVLTEGALALADDAFMRGVIFRVKADALIVDAADTETIGGGFLAPGEHLPLAQTLGPLILAAGKTCMWDDLQDDTATKDLERIARFRYRCAIATTFSANANTYVLMFISQTIRRRPFDEEDREYIELLAAFFGRVLTDLEQRQHIVHAAHHDPLTGMPNRALLGVRLDAAIEAARARGGGFALLFLDLDRFKDINDTLGHRIGDLLLLAVGERLRSCVRDSDTVARMGGDEFIILPSVVDAPRDAAHVATNILRALDEAFLIESHELYVSCSLGISVYPSDGETAETLLNHADIAMYRAKDAGRNNYQFFTPAMKAEFASRHALEHLLRKALQAREFVVYYQPQVNLRSGDIVAAEALVRWRHPERGIVAPSEFIATAEVTGLILPLGRWVLETACRQARAWHEQGFHRMRVAVNLSAHQFLESGLTAAIATVLAKSGLEGSALDLEITESVAMGDVQRTAAITEALKQTGVRISLDDFGTGYSSLSYLTRFPLDTLKIDRAFVAGIGKRENEDTIVITIIAMAHALGLNVVAEGVETSEQLDFLIEHGCDEAQGFAISPALPPTQFLQYIKAHNGRWHRSDAGTGSGAPGRN